MGWAEVDLARTWRALREDEGEGVWRLVNFARVGGVQLSIGLRLPEKMEALVVTFPSAAPAGGSRLPEGRGFLVVPIVNAAVPRGSEAIALVRRPEGDLEMFETMVIDVMRSIESLSDRSIADLRKIFLRRVEAWQEFMSRGASRPLSAEKQIGLLGELLMLESLSKSSLGTRQAIGSWLGPRHAAQDFHVRGGAIEVKSSMTGSVFRSMIHSIEQLDSERAPLYLIALTLADDENGRSLKTVVADLSSAAKAADAGREFRAALVMSGYLEEHDHNYERSFRAASERCFRVDSEFPCLRRAQIPTAVSSARYVLDIDRIETPPVDRAEMFVELGIN